MDISKADIVTEHDNDRDILMEEFLRELGIELENTILNPTNFR